MKARFAFVAIVAIVVAACAVVVLGCESREGEGSCIFCEDAEWDVASDNTDQFGDIVAETGIDPPDSAESEGPPDPCSPEHVAEVCTPYLGVWDCDCVDGSCKGGQSYKMLEFLQATDCTMQFVFSNIDQDGFDIVTCDPYHMPPIDSWLMTTFEIDADGRLEIVLNDPTPPSLESVSLHPRTPVTTKSNLRRLQPTLPWRNPPSNHF